MAGPEPKVPYNPTQGVAPEVGIGNDYLNVRATPEDFGSQVAQGIQSFGKSLDYAGDKEFQYQLKEQGELNESDAVNGETQYNDKLGAIQGAFQQLKGRDAEAALPQVKEQMKQLRQSLRGTMRTDKAAKSFDLLVDRAEGFALRESELYVKNQLNAFKINSAEDSLKSVTDRAGGIQDDEQFDYALGTIEAESARLAETKFGSGSKDAADNYSRIYSGQAWENRLESVLVNDPVKAKELLEKNKDRIPANTYTKLRSRIAGPYNNVQTRDIADDAVNQSKLDYRDSQSEKVSGDKSIIRSFKGQEGLGLGLQQGTWDTSVAQGLVQPGEKYENVEDREKVAGRLLDKYMKDYDGDLKRVAVAWFSGPGNVSPKGSALPYLVNDPVVKGKTVSEWNNGKTVTNYVDDILRRTQGQKEFGGGEYLSEADFAKLNRDKYSQIAYDNAIKKFPDRPDLAYTAFQRTQQYFNGIISREDQKDWLSVRGVHEYVTGKKRNGESITSIEDLDKAPPEVQRGWLLMQQKYPDQANNYMNAWINANLRGKAPTFGNNFWQDFQDVVNGKTKSLIQLAPDGVNRTNTGAQMLSELLDDQGTPEGKTRSTNIMNFYSSARQSINPIANSTSVKNAAAEQRFLRFIQTTLPGIKSGRLSINPEDQNYAGNDMHSFIRTDAEMSQEIFNSMKGVLVQGFKGPTINSEGTIKTILGISDKVQGRAALTEGVKKGLVSAEKAREIRDSKGWGIEQSVPKVTQ